MRYTPETLRAALAEGPLTVVVDNPYGGCDNCNCDNCNCDNCTVRRILSEAGYRHYTGGLYLSPNARIS